MDIYEAIMVVVTALVTFICGKLAKKNKYIETNLIPVQSFLIGLISACIYYLLTKDFKIALSMSGLATSGLYDLFKGAKKSVVQEVDEDSEEFDE